jgi:sporulation protein YlmC with PRC-barrel domain
MHLIIIFLAMVGLFLGTNGFAQDNKGPGKGDIAGKTAKDHRVNAFLVGKIIGSKVINMKGESIGKVQDLVIDIDTGRILYAVLESGGFLGIGDKLLPVPWKSLAALPSEGLFFLDQSKEQMAKAPAFEKNNFPDIADANWGEGIFKHYGVSGYEPRGPMDYRYDYTYGGYGDYIGHYGHQIQSAPAREVSYEKIFDAKTIKTITGQVIKVDQVPETGFGMELRMTVFVEKKEVITVYLGPAFFIVGSGQEKYFKIGDKVTVTGSQITGHGEPFMLATTVKRGNETLRLRGKDGTPEWVGWKKTKD